METMADRPGLPDQHRPKRKRVASTQPSDASHGVRPRATRTRTDTSGFVRNVSSQLQQAQSANGAHYSWPVNPGPGVTETVGSGPTALEPSCDANLQSFQTHRDTRLHSARALAQASHHHNSMQPVHPCMPYPVAAQSSGHDGPHAVPIAGHRQDPGENGFATAALLESHNSAAGALLYDPSFQHHISALIPGQLREAGVHQHQPPPSSPPPLDPAQTVAPYTAPSAASVYYGDLLPQQVQIAGPGHNINSGTAASTEACVTDCVQVTHLTRTDHLPASGQGSGVGEHSLHYQPQTALPPTSYANQALISHSQASPVHNGFPSDAGQQITDFEHSSGALGRYGAYPFDFHPPSQPQPTMGGGDTYPVHQQLGGDGSSLLVPEQPHLPQLTSQGGTAHENMPSGHDVALCGPQVSTYPVSYPAAPSQGTFGQNGWPEQEPPEKPEDQRSLPYGLANPDPASNTNSGSSVLELDGTARKTKKRSAFDEVRRRETADTRSRKACLRCRIQKGRCEVDPRNAEAECLKCQNYAKDSKKTIHHIPCYRNKLTDTVLFRKGGLKLTTPWDGTAMKDVGDRIDPHDVRTIHFTLGVCDQPLVIEVVRFNARPGDVTARYWIVREGIHGDEVRKKKELEPYCLANIWNTGNYFE
ncbi:hypothetical protein TOPH_05968 [Tolypocladium ophioglossoides CBS 100239]|uniref:Zn(2)-C6 fungal-type domain-containing protein n=1 Tax=Tolypocladium ophioglossoides (strain CBS 100239) TaxID=1163406 RepID=A0A0L0N5Q3_TOLOC|nr:hypothetical protein TOPH_05968 [Tolypocladium ophioglossoides CBS 100239]